jgi:hypothetical protein
MYQEATVRYQDALALCAPLGERLNAEKIAAALATVR